MIKLEAMKVENLRVWTANTLPMPKCMGGIVETSNEQAAMPPAEDVVVPDDDLFPKGKIVKYYEHQGYGFVLDRKGREIYFSIAEMDVIGPKDKSAIKVGAVVGYDISRASHGLHIKQIKVY